jgi:hypothetical protein
VYEWFHILHYSMVLNLKPDLRLEDALRSTLCLGLCLFFLLLFIPHRL